MVPVTGVEPVRCCHRGILSPLRLPIPPHRRGFFASLIIQTLLPLVKLFSALFYFFARANVLNKFIVILSLWDIIMLQKQILIKDVKK